MKKILVVAAHPDDEVLGCGGTIAKLTSEGAEVHLLIAAEGLTSRQATRDREGMSEELKVLKEKTNRISEILGIAKTEFLELPDNRMDTVARLEVTKKIEEKLTVYKADTIFTHFPQDLNVDHRRLSEAVLTATRPLPGQEVKKVYFFEVVSSTDWNFSSNQGATFNPNVYVNITKYMDKKIAALKVYESEMRPYPHSRSVKNVENLSGLRGATVGFEKAEAFVLAREMIS